MLTFKHPPHKYWDRNSVTTLPALVYALPTNRLWPSRVVTNDYSLFHIYQSLQYNYQHRVFIGKSCCHRRVSEWRLVHGIQCFVLSIKSRSQRYAKPMQDFCHVKFKIIPLTVSVLGPFYQRFLKPISIWREITIDLKQNNDHCGIWYMVRNLSFRGMCNNQSLVACKRIPDKWISSWIWLINDKSSVKRHLIRHSRE